MVISLDKGALVRFFLSPLIVTITSPLLSTDLRLAVWTETHKHGRLPCTSQFRKLGERI
jgi:hypothetical protein